MPKRPSLRITIRITLVVAAAFASACGSAGSVSISPEPDPLAAAPDWLIEGCRIHPSEAGRPHRDDAQLVCGIGSAGPDRNPIAARQTAIARARSSIARTIEVTIESLVRIDDETESASDGILRSIVHQLTSTTLPACQLESVWQAPSGEVFALVSLRVSRLQESLQQSLQDHQAIPSATREDLARRAATAFAAMNAPPGGRLEESTETAQERSERRQ